MLLHDIYVGPWVTYSIRRKWLPLDSCVRKWFQKPICIVMLIVSYYTWHMWWKNKNLSSSSYAHTMKSINFELVFIWTLQIVDIILLFYKCVSNLLCRNHWVLLVLCMAKREVIIFDSLRQKRNLAIKFAMTK